MVYLLAIAAQMRIPSNHISGHVGAMICQVIDGQASMELANDPGFGREAVEDLFLGFDPAKCLCCRVELPGAVVAQLWADSHADNAPSVGWIDGFE